MTFDFKKEYKAFYSPATKPSVVDVPEMTFIMADGKGCGADNALARLIQPYQGIEPELGFSGVLSQGSGNGCRR
jgi:hypothetical protein